MDSWPQYPEFSSGFLGQHHDDVLRHHFHVAQALLLYPCGCMGGCSCLDWRKKVIAWF